MLITPNRITPSVCTPSRQIQFRELCLRMGNVASRGSTTSKSILTDNSHASNQQNQSLNTENDG